MAKYVVNSRLSFAINFFLAEKYRLRSSPLLQAAKRSGNATSSENIKMSRRNKKLPLKSRKRNESVILILKLFIGGIALFSFIYSLREFNNFTIISFKFLSFMFFSTGILISSIFYIFRTTKAEKRLTLYDFFALRTLTFGSIFCAIFFLTNNYFSTDKEYIINSFIFEKHKTYRNSPNYIITQIKGVEREINIHDYNFEELQNFNNIEIKMKNGFWGFQIIKEIKLKE
jgi:hypothetical protein